MPGLRDKFTHTLAARGPEVTLETARNLTGLPIEGYVVTGFVGFQGLVDALVAVLKQDAFNHGELKTLEGTTTEGMCVFAMAAHTGCNTVYGSTPPSNPHPYPWMNSLFQDGATVGWMFGEP